MATADTQPRQPTAADLEKVRELGQRAQYGDYKSVEKLRTFLDEHDALCQTFGEVGRDLEDLLIGQASGDNFLVAESLRMRLVKMRAELAGPEATELDRRLAEHVAQAWLELHCAERQLLRPEQRLSPEAVKELERKKQVCQRSYLEAMKALASVQRMSKGERKQAQTKPTAPAPEPLQSPKQSGELRSGSRPSPSPSDSRNGSRRKKS